MTSDTPNAWPDVAGQCPSCHRRSLFLGAGGYVTCRRQDCPAPDAVSAFLLNRGAMSSDAAKGWPDVAGRCPACQRRSLFLGAGGYVTCRKLDCAQPDAATDLLDPAPTPDTHRAVLP